MNAKTKILSLLLLAIMVFSLTGCNSNVSDDKDNNASSSGKVKEISGYSVSPRNANGEIGERLLIVEKDNYYGVMDLNGNIIVECDKYTNIYDYARGLAMVEKDGKYGYIDTKGKVVVPLEYEEPYRGPYGFFKTDDVTWVKKDGKWGIINTKGEVVKEPTFEDGNGNVGNFINGYALINTKYDEKTCVDTKGNEVSYFDYCAENKYDKVYSDIEPDYNKETKLHGYKNKKTKEMVVEYKYKYAGAFSDGIAKATLPDGTQEIINEEGKALLRFVP